MKIKTQNNESTTPAIFPGTGVGKKAEEFWRAFKKAEAAGLEAFFARSLPPEKLLQVPARDRAQRLLGLRQRLGKELKLIKVRQQSLEEISLFIASSNSELFKLTLEFEKTAEKFWLKGLTVDESGPEDLAPPLPPMTLVEALKTIEHQIEKAVQEDSFSGVVLMARDFQPIFFKSYGLASKEFGVPNRTDTRFNLGSINKVFTRVAIGKLAEQGRLKLDDRLRKFLPDYPNAEAREKVTVRHLVSMTSGIGDFFGPEFDKSPKNFLRHNRDYLKLFAHKPLAFEPGTREMYSNGGYVVLGEIISAVSGFDYYDFIIRNIFEPAGMKDSGWFQAEAVVENVAEGYTRVNEEEEPAADTSGLSLTPAPAKKSEQQPAQTRGKSTSPSEQEKTPSSINNLLPDDESGRPAPKHPPDLLSLNCTAIDQPSLDSQRASLAREAPGTEASYSARRVVNLQFDIGSATTPATPAGRQTEPAEKKGQKNWRRNIYTRPARGSAAGGGYATAEDLLRFARALYEGRLLNDAWTEWVFSGVEPDTTGAINKNEKDGLQIKPDRSRWNLAIAGGAPGINAVLEFEAATGYTIIVLSNYDPPAAMQISRMIRRHLQAARTGQ
ncbi:MAG: serine hydrolase domain-containing protein [Candidatus Saccharicenans sp.]|nr:serine hydrolase domain-containing protein [Candidatus Saccharicenans sp.]